MSKSNVSDLSVNMLIEQVFSCPEYMKSILSVSLYVQWPLESAYPNIRVHTHKCIYTDRYAPACMCTYRHTYCIYVHKYIHIHLHMHTCIYTHISIKNPDIRIRIYTYIQRYINTYVRTCIYTYMNKFVRSLQNK